MANRDYKEWFAKYLGEVESPDSVDNKSLISNAPKPFNSRKWMTVNLLIFIFTLGGSLFLSWINSRVNIWYYEWGYNALLNISFGLLVSLLILIYTNLRDRNITYYTDVIPLLRKRYNDMHEAFSQYSFKLGIYRQQENVDEFFDAWHRQSNTGFVIIQFFEYLIGVNAFKSDQYKIDEKKLKKLSDRILEADRKIQDEYIHHKIINKQTYEICERAMDAPFSLLMLLQDFIDDLEGQLFTIKYDKRKLTREERDFNDSINS